MQNFNKFYNNRHTGRLLHWKPSLGFADIKMTLGEAKHELQTSTFQMVILLLFNNASQVTYGQLQQQTQISDIDLKCNLIPLLQMKLLLKQSSGAPKEFLANDVFTLVGTFRNQMYKIKVPVATAKENKAVEKSEVAEKVDEDRRHMIEATLVKVMKTRRKLEHNALITEATKILSQKFSPDPLMIKKRIESLIEREYMERDTEDRRFYKYIA